MEQKHKRPCIRFLLLLLSAVMILASCGKSDTQNSDSTTEETDAAPVELTLIGMVEGTVNTYGNSLEETLYIFGSNGTVKLGGKAANKVEFWSIAGDGRTAEDLADALPDTIYGLGHTSLYTDVIDAIKTGRAPYVTARDGMEALELVLAIYKSAAEGRPVKLPLEDCSTLDFAGRFGLTD